jgi:uncharacterized protein with von Willebrand factor type A (vWA) domain
MAVDSRALLRVIDELLWRLRRDGFEISTAQAIDAARAVAAVGLDWPSAVREAIACVVVARPGDRARFDTSFSRFFGPGPANAIGTLRERLYARGFDPSELDALTALLAELGADAGGIAGSFGALIERGADLDRLLAMSGVVAALDAHSGPMLGFLTHRLLREAGATRARAIIAALRAHLAGVLGDRGHVLADALEEELEEAEAEIRAFVKRAHDARVSELERERGERRVDTVPFTSLTDPQLDEVRRAVRRFAERLRGAARVRARRSLRGRVDPHRTLRRAMRTGGVPFDIARRQRRRDRPKMLILCDVSDSVRAAACFLLEFAYAAQELFAHARTFVFVSDLRETTRLFEREPVRVAIDRAWRGDSVVRSGDNSNYGRVLRVFEARHLPEVDRATTVVILGDGRTNYHDAEPELLDRIRIRSRALVWLCPEPRGRWAAGDSAMARYAPKCTAVYEVACARDLERAARGLISRAG